MNNFFFYILVHWDTLLVLLAPLMIDWVYILIMISTSFTRWSHAWHLSGIHRHLAPPSWWVHCWRLSLIHINLPCPWWHLPRHLLPVDVLSTHGIDLLLLHLLWLIDQWHSWRRHTSRSTHWNVWGYTVSLDNLTGQIDLSLGRSL